MSNICLKVPTQKNWHFQNFDFQNLKNSSLGQFFWGATAHVDVIEFVTSCCNVKIRGLEGKLCVAFLLI